MIHSSTRTISSVIGVAILTAPLLRISTVLKIQLMLNEKLLLLTHLVVMDGDYSVGDDAQASESSEVFLQFTSELEMPSQTTT